MNNFDTNKGKKDDLQIVSDLSELTDSTYSSTNGDRDGNGLLTPTATDRSIILTPEEEQQWSDCYARLKMSPLKATRSTRFEQIVEDVEDILRLSDSDSFKDKSFSHLSKEQQAVMIFVVAKEMHKCFGSRCMAAKALIQALEDKSTHKRMLSFVRLGGDRKCRIPSLMDLKYTSYVDKVPGWKAKTTTIIFKKHPEMKPFIHLQHEESYLCAYTACSALLYYCSYNSGKLDDDGGSMAIIKMNVSRYIRDEVSGREIANFTLTTVKGAYLRNVLLGLIKSFGTDRCHDIEKVPTMGNDEEANYFMLKTFLNDGRPIVLGIETLEAFTNYSKLQFCGAMSDYSVMSGRPENLNKRCYHALLCIGIKPRNGSIPPMLLVQDSCEHRPFFSIGLDLLMSMGIDDLELYTVPRKWRFNENMDYVMKPETRTLICGSPMSFENGTSSVLEAEKPKVDRSDMHRYFELVDPRDGPFVSIV